MTASYRTSVAGGTAVQGAVSQATITPVVDDLLIVAGIVKDSTNTVPVISDNNGDGATYYAAVNELISGTERLVVWVRSEFIKAAFVNSTTVTMTPGNLATGGEIVVVAYSGMLCAGQGSVKQANSNHDTNNTAPTTTFGSTVLTTNPTLSFVGCLTNPPNLTATTSWTRQQNVGQTTPIGETVETRDTGFTGTSIAWATTITNWVAGALELDFTNAYMPKFSSIATFGCSFFVPYGPRSFTSPLAIGTTIGLVVNGLKDVPEVIPVKQNTAHTIYTVLRDGSTGQAVALTSGLVSALTFEIAKAGAGSPTTISPSTSIVSAADGLLQITLSSSHLDTIGLACFIVKGGNGITTINPLVYLIDVQAIDVYDAVRGGMSALPNAAAASAGGLLTSGTGANQIHVDGTTGAVDSNATKILGTAIPSPTVAGIPLVEVSSMDTDSVSSAAVSAAAVTKIQSGLATSSAVAAIPTNPLLTTTNRIPSAAAGAVGGLAEITAVGQAPGGVIKPNSLEDNCVYSTGKLTSSRLRIFADSTAANAATPGNANDADHEVERYVSAASYNGDGTLATFKWIKQL